MATKIGERTRRLLWAQSDRCAFPNCQQPLVESGPDGVATTPVGIECHIVAQRDHATVARAPCLLTEEELQRHADLVVDRHSQRNVVLMCATHSKLIDDPEQAFSVDDVLEMKTSHEAAIRRERDLGRRLATGELTLEAPVGEVARVFLSVLEDVTAWEHTAMSELLRADHGAAAWLLEQLGTPEAPARLQRLVQDWPDRVAHGPHELAVALARKAERHQRYDLASVVWERIADREGDLEVRADHLARAAVDAAVGRDSQREQALLAKAEAAHPDCPRAKLQRIDPNEGAQRTLDQLREISTDDPKLQSLIELQRALSQMMLVDLAAAEESLREAERLDPGSLNARSVAVCLRVQRARVGVRDDDEFSLLDVRAAKAEALGLREELRSLGRHSESVRMLMLAADADAVERDPERAAATLSLATDDEINAPDGAEVLGDAALRALDPDLALKFTEGASGDFVRRIRATAQLERRGDTRAAALSELEALATAGGREAEAAAASRLLACLDGAPFHEASAAVLEGGVHARTAHIMRAYHAARRRDFSRAESIIDRFKTTRWGAETALRLAQMRGARDRLRETARSVLLVGADPFGRYEAGLGLARAGELEEAAGVLSSVARSRNVPEKLRSDAYNKLLRTCSDRETWDEAVVAWREWRDMLNAARLVDGRLSAWQVPVVRREASVG